jgi:hypothetical protein
MESHLDQWQLTGVNDIFPPFASCQAAVTLPALALPPRCQEGAAA